MHAPLARHLTRFSVPAVATAIVVADEAAATLASPLTLASYEAGLREAADEGRSVADAEHAESLARLEAAHAAALAAALAEAVSAAEARGAAAAGDAIAAQIDAALTVLRDDLAAQAAEALRPLLEESLLRRAVAAVGDAVARGLAAPDHPPLEMRGPAAVLAAVEARLGATVGVSFVAAEDDEVVVTGTGIRIESRLAQALAAIEEAAR